MAGRGLYLFLSRLRKPAGDFGRYIASEHSETTNWQISFISEFFLDRSLAMLYDTVKYATYDE
jgi:hypothetical protein